MKPRYIIGWVVLWLIWVYLASNVLAESVALALSCVMLTVLGLRPIALWCRGNMNSLPIMEAHSLVCIPAFVLPILQGSRSVASYDVGVQIQTVEVICVYLFCLQVVSKMLWAVTKGNIRSRATVLDRVIWETHYQSFLFMALGCWWLFTVSRTLLLLGWLGNSMNIVQTLASAAGGISVLVLFWQIGHGRFRRWSSFAVLIVVSSAVLVNFTGGFLIGGCLVLTTALLGYVMGSKKVPVVSIIMVLLFVATLHAGKAEMRTRYWGRGTNWNKTRQNPVDVYSFWLSAGIDNILKQGTVPITTTDKRGLLTRFSLAHMVMLAVSKAPDEAPFLRGQTYLESLQLLVPRILWPDKPRGSLPTETLAIHFGANTRKGVEHTSIGMGLIAEAWSNFGWAGIVVIGCLLGLLFTAPTLISSGRTTNQVGFLVGALFLTQAISLEETLGPMLIQITHRLLVFLPIAILLSKSLKRGRPLVQSRHARVPQRDKPTPQGDTVCE